MKSTFGFALLLSVSVNVGAVEISLPSSLTIKQEKVAKELVEEYLEDSVEQTGISNDQLAASFVEMKCISVFRQAWEVTICEISLRAKEYRCEAELSNAKFNWLSRVKTVSCYRNQKDHFGIKKYEGE